MNEIAIGGGLCLEYAFDGRGGHVPGVQDFNAEAGSNGDLAARQLENPLRGPLLAKVDEVVLARLAGRAEILPFVDWF